MRQPDGITQIGNRCRKATRLMPIRTISYEIRSRLAGSELTDELFPPAAIDLWHDRQTRPFECAMRKAS